MSSWEKKRLIQHTVVITICILIFIAGIVLLSISLVNDHNLTLLEMQHQVEEFGFYKKDIKSVWYVTTNQYDVSLGYTWQLISGTILIIMPVIGLGAYAAIEC